MGLSEILDWCTGIIRLFFRGGGATKSSRSDSSSSWYAGSARRCSDLLRFAALRSLEMSLVLDVLSEDSIGRSVTSLLGFLRELETSETIRLGKTRLTLETWWVEEGVEQLVQVTVQRFD